MCLSFQTLVMSGPNTMRCLGYFQLTDTHRDNKHDLFWKENDNNIASQKNTLWEPWPEKDFFGSWISGQELIYHTHQKTGQLSHRTGFHWDAWLTQTADFNKRVKFPFSGCMAEACSLVNTALSGLQVGSLCWPQIACDCHSNPSFSWFQIVGPDSPFSCFLCTST